MAKKYYAVQVGRSTGVFSSWDQVKASVDGYKGAVHKSFNTAAEAAAFANGSGGYSGSSNSSTGGVYGGSSSYGRSSYGGRSYGGNSYGGSGYGSSNSYSGGGYSGRSYGRGYGGDYGGSNVNSTPDSSRPTQVVYTDGSSRGNGRPGSKAGYGVYYGVGDPRNVSAKLEGDRQTNQRAELRAIIRALDDAIQASKSGSSYNLEIRTDSQYSRKALNEWAIRWEKYGYITSSGGDVENADLIREGRDKLSQLKQLKIDVTFKHVKGHSGDHGNEQADRLANEGAMK